MNLEHAPTDQLVSARAASERIAGVDILEDWRWYGAPHDWVLKCRLHIESANVRLVPDETDWYVLVARVYPHGSIRVHPATHRGITVTFQHQYYNGPGDTSLPWRSGNICAETPLSWIKKRTYDEEPFEPEKRLAWRLERAREWLKNASDGTLVDKGDPFELPDYETRLASLTVAYSESPETFMNWSTFSCDCGIAKLGVLREPPNTRVIIAFEDLREKVLYEPRWNAYIRSIIDKEDVALWVRFARVIVREPWQAPMKWAELLRVAEDQGFDVLALVSKVAKRLRDGKEHIALLGFPIPERIGEEANRIHWQGLMLPVLSHGTDLPSGFSRPNETAYQIGDRRLLSGPTRLQWEKSENWHQSQILNRGAFGPELSNARVLVLGAGALGSMVGEMLVRGGATSLVLIDPQEIEIGNLARHTLSLRDTGTKKVSGLGSRLGGISPHVAVHEIAEKFEDLKAENTAVVADCDIMVDTTGSDDVLFYLQDFTWSNSPFFCSISVGLQARRLYVLTAREQHFPTAFFLRHVKKWLLKDAKEYGGDPLPVSGGIGCWHPAFPARVDDMWLLASIAIKYFEKKLQSDSQGATLAIFEQQWRDGVYCGTTLVREEHDNG